ncbi:growth/differentiation factor 15 [Ctenodactylus gundi]
MQATGTAPLLLLLLLLLAAASWPPPGGALSPPGRPPPAPDADPDVLQELRRRYEHLLARLRGNQSAWASNAEPGPRPAVRTLTPQVRFGLDGNLHLRVPRTTLTRALPEAYRLHRALLRLSPTVLEPWDVTRPLKRQLSHRGSQASAIHLRLSPPPSQRSAPSPSARPQLELHVRARAGRGRRSARMRAHDGCPLGPGRCCHLEAVRVSLEDLGWTDWVAEPREVNLRMCVGECPDAYRPASLLAQAKARLHGLAPNVAPAPCCVPAGFDPMVLLQKAAGGGIALQTYDDLLASACHCA